MNPCGVVILYHPDGNIVERIKTYQEALTHLFVVDNSPNGSKHVLAPLLSGNKVTYLHDGENKGIAHRLNQVAALAQAAGYTWLLTMDQDSHFGPGALAQYLSCTEWYGNKERTAMFGVEHDEKHLLSNEQCVYANVTLLITSGSLVNIDVLLKTGGFDEALFIDLVDHEYCLRTILHGYEVIKLGNILLHHSIGNSSAHRSLKNMQLSSRSLHSPIRIYYMVRNFFYLSDRYAHRFKKEIAFLRNDLFVRLKNNLLYNSERKQVIRFTINGYRDYKLKKMGKIKQ